VRSHSRALLLYLKKVLRLNLLNTVKNWSTEERQKLAKLLSVFLESEPEGLERAVWVPENLLKSALQYLFFTVQRITGSNNLLDDPKVEHRLSVG
jgi:hypothetical protein